MTAPTLTSPRPIVGANLATGGQISPPASAAPAPLPLRDRVREHPAETWLENALDELIALEVSDVHLTLSGVNGSLTVDARLDGEIEQVTVYEGASARGLLNRLKTGAKINTSSARVPADGSYPHVVDGYPYRIRAVALPLFDGGEKVVLRLPSVGAPRMFDTLGFSDANLAAARRVLQIPAGMTLVAGPMGEGKSTTAHATLLELGTSSDAVFTVEDPVERILPGVSQIEVNEDAGYGFGQIMAYLVRADFDTLFIGEIRDPLTAAAAVRMAKAGRRVIATIHASDNVTALLRLIELSEDTPLSVLDAVSGVISQRLVKRADGIGRIPVHEVLANSAELADELIANRSLREIREVAARTSTTFEENLRDLLAAGRTSQAEVRRVIGYDL